MECIRSSAHQPAGHKPKRAQNQKGGELNFLLEDISLNEALLKVKGLLTMFG